MHFILVVKCKMELKFESEVNYQINERVQGKTDFFRQTFITIDLPTKWN